LDLATKPEASRPEQLLAWAGRHAPLVGGLLVLLVVLLAAGVRIGPPFLLLAACVACGFGLTYLSGMELLFEERLFFGTVIGAMVVTLAGFGAASLFGFSAASVGVGTTAALAVSAVGWFAGRRRLRPPTRGRCWR
jgi:hypothetical protein